MIQFLSPSTVDIDLNMPFAKVQLLDAIQRTKATTPGEHRIPHSFFKGFNHHSLDLLLQIYKSILFFRRYPSFLGQVN